MQDQLTKLALKYCVKKKILKSNTHLISLSLKFSIGGVVFVGPHPRITLINSFVCEFEAEGTIMVTTNKDRPGMVGILGACLGENGVNIDHFQIASNTSGGEAISLIRVDDDLPNAVFEEICIKVRNHFGG